MSKIVKKTFFGFICVLFTLICGCTSNSTSTRHPLIGKWQRLDTKARTIEFFDDGKSLSTVKFSTQVMNRPATYKIVDDSHIIMTTKVQRKDAKTTDIPIEYQISGNHLTMKYPNNLSLEFEKIE